MAYPFRYLGTLLSLLFLVASAPAKTPPIRIMPLGDSNTEGFGVPGGYRSPLQQSLLTAGYNADFVGTLSSNAATMMPDPDHQGLGGFTIGQIDANIAGWLSSVTTPDVILLHIGTNDFAQHVDTPNAINRLDALITKIATLQPSTHIIVTNLMVRNEPENTAIQTQFNPFVQARVNAQVALGRRVRFLNMRAFVPLSAMPDQLHPSQAGYDSMARGWLSAIQSVISPLGDYRPPQIVRAIATDSRHVVVTFNKPLRDGAGATGKYAINGLTITSAKLDEGTKRIVTLTTSAMTAAASYSLAVTGVRDRTAAANLIAPGSTMAFTGSAIAGPAVNVPEAATYSLVYSLNVPLTAAYNVTPPAYAVNHHAGAGRFTRVAYYLETRKPNQPTQYCWVSMQPFTTDAAKLGVPHLGTNATFQQPVAGMNIFSNAAGVQTGAGLNGNLEFWSTNYIAANSASVPGASSSTYDFGDQPSPGQWGSMQIHNPSKGQSLISFNHWGDSGGATLDLGIGNRPTGEPDWTAAANAGSYSVRMLQAYALVAGADPADLNGDGNGDIRFQNNAGQIVAWYMDGNGMFSNAAWIWNSPLGDWKLSGTGDLNSDGNSDLLFQNTAGQIAAWYTDGNGSISGFATISNAALGDWKLVGTADMNSDGNIDLLFQNAAGQIAAWYMNDLGAVSSTGYIWAAPLGGWKLAAIADLNSDGIADLVFQNTIGQIVVWYMNGAGAISSTRWIWGTALADWKLAATADLNSDGKADLIFQNAIGQIAAWYMNGYGSISSTALIYSRPLADWRVR